MIDGTEPAGRARETLAKGRGSAYIDESMEQFRILSAAATLQTFTAGLLARLSGASEQEADGLIELLLERRRISARKASKKAGDGHEPIYSWTTGGEMAARAEMAKTAETAPWTTMAALAQPSDRTDVEPYEDPFSNALEVVRGWIEQAESSSDGATLARHLSMARAEVRTLRRFLSGRPSVDIEGIEELARRIEMLSTRSPVEALRSKVLKGVAEAIRNAAMHVPLGGNADGGGEDAARMAFVFDATQARYETAREVEQTAGQIGAACVVLQMGRAPARARRLALEALAPFFAGPGSAKTKVFIIIDSGGETRSRTVLKELVAYFGSVDHLFESRTGEKNDGPSWSVEPTLLLSTMATPSDDWLPRGLLKHLLLQNYVDPGPTTAPHHLARLTLNDPVVFDCGLQAGNRVGRYAAHFCYHRVDVDPEHGAVIRGLVKGSFADTPASTPPEEVRLICSDG